MDMRSVTVVKEQDLSCNVGNANTNDNRDERRRVAASQLRCRSRGPGTPETNDARASCQQGPVGGVFRGAPRLRFRGFRGFRIALQGEKGLHGWRLRD